MIPAAQAAGKSAAALIERHRLDAVCRQAPIDEGLCCSINFRDGDLHSGLHRIEARLRPVPRFDRLHVQTDRGTIGPIQARQEFSGCFAVIHRRPANKTETGEGDELGYPRATIDDGRWTERTMDDGRWTMDLLVLIERCNVG